MKRADTFASEATNFENTFSDFIALKEVPHRLPRRNGKRLHTSTVFRWMSRGCKGVFLEYWKIGRNLYTTEAALMKFFTDLAVADSAHATQQHSSPSKRQRRPRSNNRQASIDEANAVLRKARILT